MIDLTIYKESDLQEMAKEFSRTIVIRTYENGNSKDTERKATKAEQKIIWSTIYGALLAIRGGYDYYAAKNTAEYIAIVQIPQANTYDTIYNRIARLCGEY